MGRRIVRGSDDLSLVVVNFSSFLFNKLKLTLSTYVNGCQYLYSHLSKNIQELRRMRILASLDYRICILHRLDSSNLLHHTKSNVPSFVF